MLGRLRQLSAEGVTLDYDGSQMVAEYDYSGPLLRRYVHGAGVDEPLVWYEGAGVADRRFLHADERGSIVAITDSAGRKLAILTYDEYGIPGPGNVLANGQAPRFQYTGQMWIASLGMYDFKARIYSPTLGRFLQADPIGYGDGLNLYGYVGGDPVNFVDPTGTLNCQREGGYASYTPEGGIVVNVGRTVCQLEDWDYNLPPSVNTSPFMGPVTKEHPAPTPEPPQKDEAEEGGLLKCLADAGSGALDGLLDPEGQAVSVVGGVIDSARGTAVDARNSARGRPSGTFVRNATIVPGSNVRLTGRQLLARGAKRFIPGYAAASAGVALVTGGIAAYNSEACQGLVD